jgi:hypothetical protein
MAAITFLIGVNFDVGWVANIIAAGFLKALKIYTVTSTASLTVADKKGGGFEA